MTYSFVHNAINSEAFPKAITIYDNSKFMSRGKGKYSYKKEIKDEAKLFFKEMLVKYFPENKIWYIV